MIDREAVYRFLFAMHQYEVLPEVLGILDRALELQEERGENGVMRLLESMDRADPSILDSRLRRAAIPIRLISNRWAATPLRWFLRRDATRRWLVDKMIQSLHESPTQAEDPSLERPLEKRACSS